MARETPHPKSRHYSCSNAPHEVIVSAYKKHACPNTWTISIWNCALELFLEGHALCNSVRRKVHCSRAYSFLAKSSFSACEGHFQHSVSHLTKS